jgi:hypothetical protein
MLVAFLAMVSIGIFTAHVLDALRTSHYAAGKSQKKCPELNRRRYTLPKVESFIQTALGPLAG